MPAMINITKHAVDTTVIDTYIEGADIGISDSGTNTRIARLIGKNNECDLLLAGSGATVQDVHSTRTRKRQKPANPTRGTSSKMDLLNTTANVASALAQWIK